MGLLTNVIRTAVISTLGAKLARGRSPIVAALVMLLVSRALGNRKDDAAGPSAQDAKPTAPDNEGGLGGLLEKFRQGGLEDLIKSWIEPGPNKPIAPDQLQQALGTTTVDDLSRQTGMPKDDLLVQLSKLMPEVIDKLTPDGRLPKASDLQPDADEIDVLPPQSDAPLTSKPPVR
jgi:uncharacterized protein YidB (DUF937 family)